MSCYYMTGGLQSSAYEVDLTIESPSISPNNKILTNDIAITRDFLNGDSGLIRILFSFTTPGDYEVTVTKLGENDLIGSPLKLNGDNNFILKSDGYYRFDVSIKPGDLINLSSSLTINDINDLQIQRIHIAT